MKRIIFIWLSLSILIACKKSEPSPKELLTAGQWKLDKIKVYNDNNLFLSYSGDIVLDLYDNGRYKNEDRDHNQTEEGDWELLNNDEDIHFIPDDGDEFTGHIDELSRNKFSFSGTSNGYEIYVYYKR